MLASRLNQHPDKGSAMRFWAFTLLCLAINFASVVAQDHAIVAQPKADVAAARFDAVLQQALTALVRAGGYSVDVESTWGSPGDAQAPQGGSTYHLVQQGHALKTAARRPWLEKRLITLS
jgi:hypothetical protein